MRQTNTFIHVLCDRFLYMRDSVAKRNSSITTSVNQLFLGFSFRRKCRLFKNLFQKNSHTRKETNEERRLTANPTHGTKRKFTYKYRIQKVCQNVNETEDSLHFRFVMWQRELFCQTQIRYSQSHSNVAFFRSHRREWKKKHHDNLLGGNEVKPEKELLLETNEKRKSKKDSNTIVKNVAGSFEYEYLQINLVVQRITSMCVEALQMDVPSLLYA